MTDALLLDETGDAGWTLEATGDDVLRESSRQTRFALSNGFLGLRGSPAFAPFRDASHRSRTLVAGLFEGDGEPEDLPTLVPAPDGLRLTLTLNGAPVGRDPTNPGHRTVLDMRRSLLVDHRRIAGAGAILQVDEARFISIRLRSMALQRIRLTVIEGDPSIELEAGLEAADARLIADHREPGLRTWRTIRSGVGLAVAIATSVSVDRQSFAPTSSEDCGGTWHWRAGPGQQLTFERLISIGRGRAGDVEAGTTARADLATAMRTGWTPLLAAHEAAWAERWSSCDIEIDGDPDAQKALRFAAFHLNGAANPDDDRVSIAARALTGDDYGGHVFWDTDIFLLPFYCVTWPEAARALLMYRFHTLDGARDKATRLGWQGALYAWESADTGADVTPAHSVAPDRRVTDILCGTQEQHISADVAYAVWQYWTITGDAAFLRDAGAEILLETARFWASRATLEADGRRHTRGLIGPDEYHETIDDNAFTNVMARWNIERGVEVAGLMGSRWPDHWAALCARLDLDEAEMGGWPGVARAIGTGQDERTGLFEQFEGYFGLEQIDLTQYAGRSVPMDVVLGPTRTAKSQIIKQADVVALVALLPEVFADDSAAANFAFYEPRCSHGSSLSTAMHGLVAARLGQAEVALEYFRRTAAIDLCEDKAAIGGGIHIAAQGGLWMTAVLGFAGVSFLPDGIALQPKLPPGWSAMRFPLQWQGRSLRIAIDPVRRCLSIRLEHGDLMAAYVEGVRYALLPGEERRIGMGNAERPGSSP